ISNNNSTPAGLNYCRGLYSRYTNNTREALIQFNYSRKDVNYGKLSIMNMIEIYLNPDNSELFSEINEAKASSNEISESLSAVERLLQDLTKLGENNSVKYKILEAYSL